MRRIKWIILATVTTLILFSFCVQAEYSFNDVETLRGIKSMFVYVENLPPEAKKFGLTRKTIRTDVKSKLREAGIKVVSKKECYDIPGSPYLYIGIGMLCNPQHGIFALTTHIELRQITSLVREPSSSYHTTTWIRGETKYVEEKKLENLLRSTLKDWVDLFIYDYLTVNPKQTTHKEGLKNEKGNNLKGG